VSRAKSSTNNLSIAYTSRLLLSVYDLVLVHTQVVLVLALYNLIDLGHVRLQDLVSFLNHLHFQLISRVLLDDFLRAERVLDELVDLFSLPNSTLPWTSR